MNILSLDTSSYGCSVCAVRTDGAVFTDIRRMPSGQAEHLVPMAQGVMAQAGLEYADLGAVLSTIGPGAYTGLRIGMVTAQSFSMALGIPVYGVSSMQALAWQYADAGGGAAAGNFSVLIETRRTDFYAQDFDVSARALSDVRCVEATDIETLAPTILIGDCLERFETAIGGNTHHTLASGYDLINPAIFARVFAQGAEEGVFIKDPAPLYLRAPDVSAPKHPQRVVAES